MTTERPDRRVGPYDGIVVEGHGDPVTLFASGGIGGGNFDWMRTWSAGMPGTRVCFEYGAIEPWLPGRPPRREAERDAAEAGAVAGRCGATCAVGVSRGARAILGVLAEDIDRLDRVILVIPPGGTAAGRYREWLRLLPANAVMPVTGADILVLCMRGDTGHPVKVAQDWADRLGAEIEVFRSAYRMPDVLELMGRRCKEFLERSGN